MTTTQTPRRLRGQPHATSQGDTSATGATTREGYESLVGRGRAAGRSPLHRRETAPARAGSSRGNIDAGPKRPFWKCHPDGAGHGQKRSTRGGGGVLQPSYTSAC